MIAIAFALPQESRSLVAAMHAPVQTGLPELPIITGKIGEQEVVIFHTGVGSVSARDRLHWFWRRQTARRIDCVIGAGFAGGLDPSLPAGALVLAENYPGQVAAAQAALGDRVRVGPLATAPTVLETAESKAELARQSGAIAVDMETATVAEFFRKRGVPFMALRAISDVADEALPVPTGVWFDDRIQCPRPWALLGFLLLHPFRVLPFTRFVAAIRHARRMLASGLFELLAFDHFTPAHAAAGPTPRRR